MKLKLDENLGAMGQSFLRSEGHDVTTVVEQKLRSATDEVLAKVCADEERVIVTLDLDFANTLRFPPEQTAGIAVLRPSGKGSRNVVFDLVRTFGLGLRSMKIDGKLWVVEPGRIRVHESELEE